MRFSLNEISKKLSSRPKSAPSHLKLENGSRVAVIGGGPAGSFFSYHLLDIAKRAGLDIAVDIYESKNFSNFGPTGCNYCGGIVSESLVQILATEGINLPEGVAQRGIDCYTMHTDVGSIRIQLPLQEKRIAAVHRASGPLGMKEIKWYTFDGYIQDLTIIKGAYVVRDRVESIHLDKGRPRVTTRGGSSEVYDLIVGATGVNTSALKMFQDLGIGYQPPETRNAFICEFPFPPETVQQYFGNSMHVFLLNIPRLEFGALIPKGHFVTLCLLGENIDKALAESFMNTPEVKSCFPPDWNMMQSKSCQCLPKINIRSAIRPFADRVVLVGDAATTRLFKDGIGASYVTSKAAATTAVLEGISAETFEKYYWPTCKKISHDNAIGMMIFSISALVKKMPIIKHAFLRLIAKEQFKAGNKRHLSTILWDTFTGSAPYRDIFKRMLNPFLAFHLFWNTIASLFPFLQRSTPTEEPLMKSDTFGLGRTYEDGEFIIKQGDLSDCMYVIQSGKVHVTQHKNGKEIRLGSLGEVSSLGKGDFFGEMALFEHEPHSASVRAEGRVRVLTIDKKTLLNKIKADPTLAFHFIQQISSRLRKVNSELCKIKSSDRRNWDTRPETAPDFTSLRQLLKP